uniref:Uncharacterized protein n=1 Tax=Hippocampus comes TaxID=109280 RepID=A0A3Q2Y1W0_HIPCM
MGNLVFVFSFLRRRSSLQETPHCPVDGGLSPWGSWSSCSLSCGGLGLKTRTRGCTQPAPAHGGKGCIGPYIESTYCQRNCTWTDWGTWGSCSRSCGVGQQQRIRTFLGPGPNGFWCDDILGGNIERRFCNIRPCRVDASWSRWSPWSRCDKLCGGGRSIRTRSCSSPPPKNGGKKCQGEKNQVKPCNTKPCGDSWSNWASCSVTCGHGRRTRYRLRSYWTVVHVISLLIPVDGGWTPWSVWSDCSETCGQGTQVQTRACINPPPRNNGSHCDGPERQNQECHAAPCLGL